MIITNAGNNPLNSGLIALRGIVCKQKSHGIPWLLLFEV
jgi:hypothetical protein